jgi:GNAT superfamily N-acetyltransferase
VSLEIVRVEDEAGAAAWHEVDEATTPIDRPGLVAEPLEDIIGMLPNPLPSFEVRFYVARDGGKAVANAFFGLPMMENLHLCNLQVAVLPTHRRRGVGGELTQHLLEVARRSGRRVVSGIAGAPLESTSPGDEMAQRLGAAAALVSIRRELRLDQMVRTELEATLTKLQAGPCDGYEFVSWRDVCPGDLVDGAAAILPRVMTDSPRGTLDLEDEIWDEARYREYEAMFAARHRHQLVAAALHRESGLLAAFTDLNVPFSEHRVVAQFGTVVEPAHRGQRLGVAVKTANLLNLMDAFPDAETVQTYNAEENVHMIAVNEEIGFRPVERLTHWQLEI